ncbi:monothiol glutaredoxin-S2-like protein [Tanacetum coccineum]
MISSFGANATVYELDEHPEGKQIEKELRGLGCKPSVPAVFIGEKLIGGADEIMSLDLKEERSFTRDLYSMGRTILTCETKGNHKIQDDDDIDELCYQNEEKFAEDMEETHNTDPLAHDLVKQLLAYK